MWRTAKIEIKNSICNLRFLYGILVIFCATWIGESEHLRFLLDAGTTTEGPGWYTAFLFCVTSTNGLLFVPLMTPFAAGADAQTELESRYYLFSFSRTGKRRYLIGKAAALFFSGGLMVGISMIFFLLFGAAGFRQVSFLNDGEISLGVFVWEMILHVMRGFFNGAFWALTGGFASVITKNRYMACTVPFVLYYVLSVFQERYYRNLPFLNPRYWATTVYYSNPICIGILLALCFIVTIFFVILMKRRVEHA